MELNNYTGVGWFILLVLDLWAIVSVLGSSASTGRKVIWVLAILILPFLGFIAWLFLGPRANRS
jgi:hypothetical protein